MIWRFGSKVIKRNLNSIPRVKASLEREIIENLNNVIESITQKSLSSLGCLKSVKAIESTAIIDLDFFINGYPFQDEVIENCKTSLKKLTWLKNINIQVNDKQIPFSSEKRGLENVKHVIAVSSCKGGVGKSTVAVNLAFSLAQRGLKVGLLDTDIYGPSLPYMVTPDDPSIGVRKVPDLPSTVYPLQRGNVKFLSFGHVNPKAVVGAGGKTAAVLRGPIATRVINQLIAGTLWGDLDYMIVDLPPGTGDIQITLTQSIAFTGAVIVTTPHPLAIADVVKGVEMFYNLKIPVLSLVENMSYFKCNHGEVYHPLGKLPRDKLKKDLILASDPNYVEALSIHSFPLTSELSDLSGFTHNENISDYLGPNIPFVERNPHSEISQIYNQLSNSVLSEIFKIQLDAQLLPQLSYLEKKKEIVLRYYTETQAIEYYLPTPRLRYSDPLTGDKIIPTGTTESELIQKFQSVKPVKFDMKGNYGVSIVWDDGHYADIFSFDILKKIANDIRS